MLEIINVSKSYDGKKNAVDNVSLTINKGDIYGFVGHNGAGKTTLLKSIVGLIDFDSGDILVNGVSVKKDIMGVKKQIAYVPDNPDVYETMKGIEYLNFIADAFKVTEERRIELINKYAKLFGMENVLTQTIQEYSHGMKQKIVLISALIHEPKVLLLDEPFVGLDPQASFLLKNEFKAMCEKGSSIFFSTHVLEVVEKLCNKVAIIKNGKIVESGLTEKIISNKSLETIFMELEKEYDVS
ncbi:ABC transporter ATP-binding protein [Acholeplasma granularum]|uniref:ABC transporter ATP-binding protein n=1 Tax=Acholeplasma granularum TaxID=264635 RepID=UPI000470FB9D|nr:ABC transporter ATP-binding protein [Acholeplasma granularum]